MATAQATAPDTEPATETVTETATDMATQVILAMEWATEAVTAIAVMEESTHIQEQVKYTSIISYVIHFCLRHGDCIAGVYGIGYGQSGGVVGK